jgi:hypothetical protein
MEMGMARARVTWGRWLVAAAWLVAFSSLVACGAGAPAAGDAGSRRQPPREENRRHMDASLAEALAPVATDDRLQRHVHDLVGSIGARHMGRAGSLERAADWVEQRFREVGFEGRRVGYEIGTTRVENLEFRLGEAAPGEPVVLVGAHYDTVPGSPGADDNASGVAVLIELARELRARPPAGPVWFVAFTNEEPPYFRTKDMGSVRYAEHLREQGRAVRLMVALDCVGHFADVPQRFPLEEMATRYPKRGTFVAIIANPATAVEARAFHLEMRRRPELRAELLIAPPTVRGVDFSDHLAFWQAGVPALLVTDTAFYRNPRYHKADDEPGSLDYRRMAVLVDQLAAAVRAATDRRPAAGASPASTLPAAPAPGDASSGR